MYKSDFITFFSKKDSKQYRKEIAKAQEILNHYRV